MKVWLRFLLLFFMLLPLSAYSQKLQKNVVMYRDPVTGVDTLMMGITLEEKDERRMQYEIVVRKPDGKTFALSARDVKGYRLGKKIVHSRQVEVNGEVRYALLPRLYGQDSLWVYSFIADDGKRASYVQLPDEPLLVPLADAADARRVNPRVQAYLKSFPVASDARVEAYIDGMSPTVLSLEKRHLVCRTGNLNYITRFRWGVMLGGGLGKLAMDDYGFDTKLQGSVGLFADVPLFDGLSVRPEVTFSPYAYGSHQSTDVVETHAVYNRKDVTGTLLFRYTVRSFEGKWLPYAMLGAEVNKVLDCSLESAERWLDDEGFTVLERHSYPQPKGMTLGVTGGVGVEYLLTARHSLFLDMRYRYELEEEGLRGFCLTVSINL